MQTYKIQTLKFIQMFYPAQTWGAYWTIQYYKQWSTDVV